MHIWFGLVDYERIGSLVLIVHAPTEDNIEDVKFSLHEELTCVVDKFPNYRMKIRLQNSNIKVDMEDIIKPTTGSQSLHEFNDDNGVTVAKLAGFKTCYCQKHNVLKKHIFTH
jgi:hypothetical protein